jgi:hypothetical protein
VKPDSEHNLTSDRRALVCRIAWLLFAPAIVYLCGLQYWIVTNRPGMVAGTRIYWLGAYGIAGAAAELLLIVMPVVALFANWRKGLLLVALSGIYFSAYLLWGPY